MKPLEALRYHVSGAIERGEAVAIEAVEAPSYTTSYRYLSPGPAGPFKGSMITPAKHKKGANVAGPFGAAIVVSSRLRP